MFRDLSLKVKLPMYLSAVLATATLVLAVVAYGEVRRASLGAAGERLQRVTTQLVSLTELGFDARLASAAALASDVRIATLLSAPEDPSARAAVGAALDSTLQQPQVVAIDILDSDGRRVLLAGDESRVPREHQPVFTDDAATGPFLAVSGGVAYPTTMAAVGEGGEVQGGLAIWRQIQVDSAGREVLGDLIGVDGTILFGSLGGVWTDLVGEIAAPAVDFLEGTASDAGTMVSYDRPGVGRVFAMPQRVERSPWYIVVELPADGVLAAAHEFLLRLALLAPLALLIVAGSAWVLGRTLTRSLADTAKAAEAIAAGEVGRRVIVRGQDEIGRLGHSFNEMAQRIEDSQKTLESRNAWLQTMLDGAPLPIIALTLRGRVRMWNRACTETFGWSAEEVLHQHLPLRDPDGHPLEVAKEAPGVPHEYKSFGKDGRPMDLLAGRAPTVDSTGRVNGYMLVFRDISARKNAELKLARYAAELSRSNAELEDFAYVASHDLREPIRMVKSFTQLLAKRYSGQLDEEADQYIRFAVDGASKMEALVRDLLEYSRLDGDHKTPSPTSAEGVLQQALAILAPAIEETAAVVTYDPLPMVMSDPDQLLRVFQNLIGNALKFHGDQPPRVHISASVQANQSVISVRDHGIGISEEYFSRIFVIFKRLHGPAEFGGTGIGLSVCKKIVERHGGKIWVESKPGEGATFHFSIPAVAMVA